MTLHTDTARLTVRKVADANGWTRHGQPGTWDRDVYVRDGVTVNVRFGVRGGIASAEEHGGGVNNVAGDRNKRETVLGWLTEAPAVDPAAGTYPTLDAAEHGQPLASLERLAYQAYAYAVAAGAGEAYTALIHDQAATVRARIADLVAERDQARADYAQLRHAHAELEDESSRQAATIRNLVAQLAAKGHTAS